MSHIDWKIIEKLNFLEIDCLSFLIPPDTKYYTDYEIFSDKDFLNLPEFNVARWHGPIVSKKSIKTEYSFPFEVDSTVYRWYEDDIEGFRQRMEILFIDKEFWYAVIKQHNNFLVVSVISGHPEVICNNFCWGKTMEDTSINLFIEHFDSTFEIVSYIMDCALQLIYNF